MSRIGNKPIALPSSVKVESSGTEIIVTGPKGKLSIEKFAGISIEQNGSNIIVKRDNDSKEQRAKHGLTRALLANHIIGTSQGYTKILLMTGVGYRAQKKGRQLVMSLGFSHDVVYDEPADVSIEVPEPTKVKISGIDKQRVGQVAADIRAYKKPEPYKGKGIRYEDEVIRRKAGKTGKK